MSDYLPRYSGICWRCGQWCDATTGRLNKYGTIEHPVCNAEDVAAQDKRREAMIAERIAGNEEWERIRLSRQLRTS